MDNINEKPKTAPQVISTNVNNTEAPLKKKNRNLQFYKFLFYSNKLEILLQDFLFMIRSTNQAEIVLWVISLILYFNTPDNKPEFENNGTIIKYGGDYIGMHLFHVVRGVLGLYIWFHLPRMYQLIDKIEQIEDTKLEKKFFNDIMREYFNENVLIVFQKKRISLWIHLGLTAFNLGIDIVDFFFILSGLKKTNDEGKVPLIIYQLIALLYIIIDLSYFIYLGKIIYILPKKYLAPVIEFLDGYVQKMKVALKIGKKETDVKKEHEVQNDVKLPEIKEQIVSNQLPQLNEQIITNNANNIHHIDEVKIDL